MTSTEFVCEIYSEEIPARFQANAAQQFKDLFLKNVHDNTLDVQLCDTYITPQRMILHAVIANEIKATTLEKRGPRLSAPDKAVEGFCASVNLSKDQLIEKEGYYVAIIEKPAQSVTSILPCILNNIIRQFQWVKTMRWPQSPTPWVRPVRHVFTLLDGKAFECHLDAFNLTTTPCTRGHRFLSPDDIYPNSFQDYKDQLETAHVIIETKEREKRILETLKKDATERHLNLIMDEKLLQETAGLVEYPGVFIGKLDASLFNIPEEVITTSMRFHQKCFAFRDQNGRIAPYFAAIINTIPTDNGKALTQGYEMGMLKARLDDARFFYDNDLKTPLADHNIKLSGIVFHEKLGTLADKLRRMHTAMAEGYAMHLNINDCTSFTRAIDLCKSDLLTQMVGEFAELQGIMGEIYAKAQDENEETARALREYYQPLGGNDNVPTHSLSIALALLDKMDTLTGFVGHGILPTGSKDPYALRRSALGILRILLENNIDINLSDLIHATEKSYLSNNQSLKQTTTKDLLTFLHTRLLFYFKDKGFSHGIVQACMPLEGADLFVKHIHHKIRALTNLIETEEGKALLAGFKRACNIFDAESRKDHKESYAFQDELLKSPEERSLFEALLAVEKRWDNTSDYIEQCQLLGSLKASIDSFFEAVMVNDDDALVRANRLGLLQRIIVLFDKFSDFRVIE